MDHYELAKYTIGTWPKWKQKLAGYPMGVYEDMANDAGCAFGSPENAQLAALIKSHHAQQYQEWCEEREEERRREILFRKFTYDDEPGCPKGPESGIILALKTIKSSMAFISHHGHHTGYDWNKDEHSLTKLEGDTFKMIDELIREGATMQEIQIDHKPISFFQNDTNLSIVINDKEYLLEKDVFNLMMQLSIERGYYKKCATQE